MKYVNYLSAPELEELDGFIADKKRASKGRRKLFDRARMRAKRQAMTTPNTKGERPET